MASLAEIEALVLENRNRVLANESLLSQILDNTVKSNWIDINAVDSDGNNIDKSDRYVFGKKVGINNGALIVGWKVNPNTPNPTTDNDFVAPYGFSQS